MSESEPTDGVCECGDVYTEHDEERMPRLRLRMQGQVVMFRRRMLRYHQLRRLLHKIRGRPRNKWS